MIPQGTHARTHALTYTLTHLDHVQKQQKEKALRVSRPWIYSLTQLIANSSISISLQFVHFFIVFLLPWRLFVFFCFYAFFFSFHSFIKVKIQGILMMARIVCLLIKERASGGEGNYIYIERTLSPRYSMSSEALRVFDGTSLGATDESFTNKPRTSEVVPTPT